MLQTKTTSETKTKTKTKTKTPVLLFFAIGMLFHASGLLARELPEMPQWLSGGAPAAEPELFSDVAIVLEAETGAVLYEKRADDVVPPASLTKVMTIHLVLESARDGAISLDERFEVPPEAWARNMPPGSSLMFLGPGQHVSLRRLTEGLAVASGNDAAVAVALRIAGSVEGFVDLMNQEADRLGYEVMEFSDPAGLRPTNRITAREYADFLRYHINRWPEALGEVYAKPRIVYPTQENFDTGMIGGPVQQENRNPLLLEYPGVDGIKTGYIWSSGYNLAVSAERDGMRLIVVTLGAHADSAAAGMRQRAADGATLLDHGFENYSLAHPNSPRLEPLRVWNGVENHVTPVADEQVSALVVPKGRQDDVRVTARFNEKEPVAPLQEHGALGTLEYRLDDTLIKEVPLVAEKRVEEAGFLKRLWHSIKRFASRLFG
ncbi:MAG: D-alanyl-D-alanine carboxypeptidase family protein [Spirochaetota bacterium]